MEQNPSFSKYRNSERLQFFEDAGSTCKKVDIAALKLQTQVDALVQATLNLSNNFKNELASAFTSSLTELDTDRDTDIRLVKNIADAYTRHFDDAKSEAARLILRSIDKYGKKIYRLNYQAQTSVLTNLGNDLKQPEAAAAIELLGLSDVCDHMISTNKQFNTQYLNRLDEKADDDDVKTVELIKEATIKWDELVTFIDANMVLNPSEALTSLVNKLNELIEAYNNTVAMRYSKTQSNN
ncbi:DUF6261 family protein [Labilibacter marinus]|uniref:DUF6261 family protein n=1 Tax=Labilibacter marinus TaxID=1477105 RepID=UPI00095030FF|nr:DUF6261 family protein [Labilibacter marinus]